MKGLTVVFTANEVTLTTAAARRTVPYRIRERQGPMVELERERDGQWLGTSVMVQGDAMTWFDTQGEIEFVLRRGGAGD